MKARLGEQSKNKIAVITAGAKSLRWFRIDMMKRFIEFGYDVVAIADESEADWQEEFASFGITYRQWRVARNSTNPLKDLKATSDLTRLLKEEQPQKVFTYHAKGNVYGCIAAHRAGIEQIYCMVGGLGSLFNSNDLKSKIVRLVLVREYQFAFKYATRVFFQNNEDVATFEKAKVIKREDVVLTRGSGVNLEQFPKCPLPERTSFLFVGRLVRGKGVMDYLDAARIVKKQYPNTIFNLVGPFDTNPTSLKYEDFRPYIDDEVVVFHGEQKNVQPFQEASSCFVLPSYYGEGTPKSALEAMATGRPLIVADAVGCREVVKEGVNGFLVPPKNPEAIAKCMLKLIEDKALLLKMAEESRKMAEDIFDVNKVNQTICETMGIR